MLVRNCRIVIEKNNQLKFDICKILAVDRVLHYSGVVTVSELQQPGLGLVASVDSLDMTSFVSQATQAAGPAWPQPAVRLSQAWQEVAEV